MYTILAIFFISLIGISTMLLRKVTLIRQSGQNVTGFEEIYIFPETNPEALKHLVASYAKRYGYAILFVTIRTYMRTSKLIKTNSGKAIEKISKMFYRKNNAPRSKAVSSFLNSISEYKKKIEHIKQEIKEKEGL